MRAYGYRRPMLCVAVRLLDTLKAEVCINKCIFCAHVKGRFHCYTFLHYDENMAHGNVTYMDRSRLVEFLPTTSACTLVFVIYWYLELCNIVFPTYMYRFTSQVHVFVKILVKWSETLHWAVSFRGVVKVVWNTLQYFQGWKDSKMWLQRRIWKFQNLYHLPQNCIYKILQVS